MGYVTKEEYRKQIDEIIDLLKKCNPQQRNRTILDGKEIDILKKLLRLLMKL